MGWLSRYRAGDIAGLANHFAHRLRWRHGGFKSPAQEVPTHRAGRHAAPLNPLALLLGLHWLDWCRRCGM